MNNVFGKISHADYKASLKKWLLIFGLGFVALAAMVTLLIVFRRQMGVILSLIIGVMITSGYFILLYVLIDVKLLPAARLDKLVARLAEKEPMILRGIVGVEKTPLTRFGQTFRVLTIIERTNRQDIVHEVYFWSPSLLEAPQLGIEVEISLVEQTIVGWTEL